MAIREYRFVPGEYSEVHDEPPHRGESDYRPDVHARVELRGLSPERDAERDNLDIVDSYEALAYDHRNPEEMERVAERHRRAAEEAK